MQSKRRYMFTSESVAEGHPDKMADQISDAILDAIIAQDTGARVACETFVTTGLALIAGEISTDCYVHLPKVVRNTIKEIGYDDPKKGFDWETCAVLSSIDEQSPDIAMGTCEQEDTYAQGAGDQGLMFGYATNETPEYMPMPIVLAHKLMKKFAEVRKKEVLPYLKPDGKSQVTVIYENGLPKWADTVVLAAQHAEWVEQAQVKKDMYDYVISEVIPENMMRDDVSIHVNATGKFIRGGPHADAGMTGRKIIVDTYGGQGSHGGGAFSGKDPSKVDRSASYAARWVAKNIVAAGLADKCEVQLAYSIGLPDPISILVNTKDTAKIDEVKIESIIGELFDLRPRAIIDRLDLLRPIYRRTACYGHFGRDEPGFTWENLDMVEELRDAAGL